MMKRLRYSLLAILALFTLTVSCVDPLEPVPVNQSSIPDNALVFSPKVLGITPATKTTDGEVNRGENAVTRLDVFVYKYKTTGGSVEFLEHYTIGDGSTEIDTGVDHLLESNWRTKYTTTDTYRIYAIANINANKLNNPVLPTSPTEAQLLALTSESDATITGQYGYTCYDIVRLQNLEGTIPAVNGSLDHHISKKLFLMDGKIDNWKVDPNATRQYFTKYPSTDAENYPNFELSRAAAKFRVTLDFSTEFKNKLGTASDYNRKFTQTEYWDPDAEEKKIKSIHVITIGKLSDETNIDSKVTGGPRMKFANFLKSTYNITPPEDPSSETVPTDGQLTTFRNENLWDSQNFYEFSFRTPAGKDGVDGYTFPYIDTTYSYAFNWNANEAAEKAPALAVSVVYTSYTQRYAEDGTTKVGGLVSDGGVTNYYRIPLVDIVGAPEDATTNPVTPARDPVNAVERNYYYQVKAEINTMGTSITDIEPNKVHLKYKIIPWPDAPDEKTEAQTTQLLYFVPEKEYRLRGDGEQFVYLQYFTPKSDPIAGTTYYEYTPKIKNIKVYYNNQSGAKHYLVGSETSGASSSGSYIWDSDNETPILATDPAANVHIEVQANAQGGRFYILSEALENRSVKYIEFDAEVDFGSAGGTVTHKIRVYHFPLDNLQSVLGAWSSRWNGNSSSTSKTEFSFNPAADGWDSWTGYDDGIECTFEEYNSADPEHRSTSTTTGTRLTTREEFLNNVTTNTDRASANNENAGYDYWGTSPLYVRYISGYNPEPALATTSDDWDYWSPYYNGYYDGDYNMYKYSSYYTKATITTYTARRYYRTVTVNVPSTGNWVDWDRDKGKTYNSSANAKYTYDGSNFEAKVYNNGLVYGINVSSNYTYSVATTQESVEAGMGGYYYYTAGAWYRFFTNDTRERVMANMTGLNNNHMYVIQISKAGKDKYGNDVIIGRPVLDGNYQSDDNTVSPAFMIASQLGAVSTFGSGTTAASDAASHCHTYMEVAQNGRRFTGWRLPTQAEVAYIIQYQTDLSGSDVFDDVLTGHYYYTLNKGADGNRWADTGKTDDNNHAVRCIRDLTPEEVKELNDTRTITSNTY